VGTLNVRKGVPTLLKAWKQSGIDGELVLAGGVHAEMEPFLAPFRDDPSVKLLNFVEDLSALYDSADFLVFPSLEEGGPQVGYEAAGSGLPVITTEAGRGRIIEDGLNGLIVAPSDADGLADAMVRLAESVDLRERFGRRGAADSRRFAYDVIAQQRAESFAKFLGRA
jgi:glycosyltransferase involved in cell wall biosynthesis